MDSICSVCVWVIRIVPNRCAVLKEKPYICDVEMQELVVAVRMFVMTCAARLTSLLLSERTHCPLF